MQVEVSVSLDSDAKSLALGEYGEHKATGDDFPISNTSPGSHTK